MALSRIGVAPIQSVDDADSIPAAQAVLNFDLALATVGRSHAWNCLLKAQNLAPEAQQPINPTPPVPPSTNWAPNTAYTVGEYITYGEPQYLYQALIDHTSTASFTNDLTSGFWMQTDIFNSNPFGQYASGNGSLYPSGWAYKYPLPEDSLLVVSLNGGTMNGYQEEYEIIGTALYTDWNQAVIQYTWADPDTTRYDGNFVEILVLKLASFLATILRQDDLNIASGLEAVYLKKLAAARARDAGERMPRRYSPVANSTLVASRRWSTNGTIYIPNLPKWLTNLFRWR